MDLTATAIQTAETLVKPWATALNNPEPNRIDAILPVEALHAAAAALVEAQWGYLIAITGLDHPGEPEGTLEFLYHFGEAGCVLTLRVSCPYSQAKVPSLCDLIPSATLYERELIEMFGVDIENTPDRDHLLLPDDWPMGVYPLRKSFTGLNTPQA